ncbi:hypothetical protein ACFTY7_43495 [Streptomyces sp. NPDC057062]|uniref:hypothetical protein n=1 Tax=Streptomyces sp. NPDC057062 TaxID=3346011 RepID=UPI003629DD04
MANVIARSRTPVLSASDLGRLGFRLAIYPLLSAAAAAAAVEAALSTLAESGLPPTDAHGPAELFGIVGLDGWLEWSQEYTGSTAAGSATD